ncbi:MAG: CsbD family protein [Caldilineaceae bacterium]|nr:CsbD family protein [Caldilineaceae bacterium]
MNRDILRGNWNQLKGSVKERWGELTENEVAEAEGNYDQLVGKIQERYGYERQEAEREVDRWLEKQKV